MRLGIQKITRKSFDIEIRHADSFLLRDGDVQVNIKNNSQKHVTLLAKSFPISLYFLKKSRKYPDLKKDINQLALLRQLWQFHLCVGYWREEGNCLRAAWSPQQGLRSGLQQTACQAALSWGWLPAGLLGHGGKTVGDSWLGGEWHLPIVQQALLLESKGHVWAEAAGTEAASLPPLWQSCLRLLQHKALSPFLQGSRVPGAGMRELLHQDHRGGEDTARQLLRYQVNSSK